MKKTLDLNTSWSIFTCCCTYQAVHGKHFKLPQTCWWSQLGTGAGTARSALTATPFPARPRARPGWWLWEELGRDSQHSTSTRAAAHRATADSREWPRARAEHHSHPVGHPTSPAHTPQCQGVWECRHSLLLFLSLSPPSNNSDLAPDHSMFLNASCRDRRVC